MTGRALLGLTAIAALAVSGASGQTIVRSGRPYSGVHAQLAEAGYRPFRILVPGSKLYHRGVFNRDDVFKLYPEVVECAGSGLGDCNFILARGPADIILVHTTGEYASALTFRDLRHVSRAQAEARYR